MAGLFGGGEPAVSVCFEVSIDDRLLGSFNSCEGLGVELVSQQLEEGGNNTFVHQLPTRIKYPNIKLTRPVGPDSALLVAWLVSATVSSVGSWRTATIAAKTAQNSTVAQWWLAGVSPVRWTGPSLNFDSPKVATETLEIAHQGFLPALGLPL